MKFLFAGFLLSLAAAPAFAQKPCAELKSEITAKLEAKGVKNYQLEIVPADAVKDQTVVGSCEFGTKKITYKKDASPAKPSTAPAHPGPARK
jgi:hypothetical protein